MSQLYYKKVQIIKTIFHIIFIATVLTLLIIRSFNSLPQDWLFFFTSDAFEYFIFTIISYTFFYYILKQETIWNKIGYTFIALIIIIGLASLKSYRKYDAVLIKETFNFFTEFLGKTFLFYMLIYCVDHLDFFNRYKKMEYELNATKRKLLTSQLHPHFLFNAFNSLYSLSLKENSKILSDYILKLSSMMRYITDDASIHKVKLSQELKFIEQYISIEKLKFGSTANIHLDIHGNLKEKIIEPLLLISLVENAFKHGFYTNQSDAFIHIKCDVKNELLLFEVRNSIQHQQHFNKNNRNGKGINNLKERLKLLYPKKHKLVLLKKEDIYVAKLEIILS